MTFQESYKTYKVQVEEALTAISQSKNLSVNLSEPIEYMISLGGKRLRPVLSLAACHAFSENYTVALKPALGIELFHNFSLIHDDIMDKAPQRRGLPTVHQKWNLNTGILSGDMMLIKAYQFISEVPPHVFPIVFNVFNQTALEVCEGQQMDMDFEQREHVTEEEYILMIKYKTAVLVGAALQLGAILGGASEKDALELYNFGCKIGIAFQIKDDWLDCFGDASKVGKRVGGDIIENKKTLLWIHAKSAASITQKDALVALAHEEDEDTKVQRTLDIYNDLSISSKAHAEMQRWYNEALDHLRSVSLPENKKQFFEEFAEYLIHRDF